MVEILVHCRDYNIVETIWILINENCPDGEVTTIDSRVSRGGTLFNEIVFGKRLEKIVILGSLKKNH